MTADAAGLSGQPLCEQCGENPAQDLHTCPYRQAKGAANADSEWSESLCNCCDACHQECWMRS